MSQEGTCAGGWPGRRWVGPHRGTLCSGGPPRRWCPPAPHQVWAPSAGHQVREAPAQSGAWGGGSGTFESSAQGSVGRDRRPGPATTRRPPLPSKSGDWRRGGLAARRTPRSPGRRALLEPGAAFWLVVLAVWVRKGCERRRRGQEGKGLASAPGVSCPGQHQVSGGQGQVRSQVLSPAEPAPGGFRGTRGLTSPTGEVKGQGGSP